MSHGTETVTRVKVEFSEEEYKLLISEVKPPQVLAEFIHDVVMRSLRRKARKGMKGLGT